MSKEDKREGRMLPRDQRRIDPERERHGKNKRKDTKRWCRGKEGKEHQPITSRWFNLPCDRYCWHRMICSVCGKRLWGMPVPACPDKYAR